MNNSISMSSVGKAKSLEVIVINCKPRIKRSEPSEQFKSSERVRFKGVQLKRRAATDKAGKGHPCSRSIFIMAGELMAAVQPPGPNVPTTQPVRSQQQIKILNKCQL